MRLKILVVPFLLVMMLVLSIGYIKPDFDAILAKRAEILSQNILIGNMDATLTNIRTLNSSLDKEQDSEKFLLRYLPYTISQDQAVDTFNYLASQSGLIITGMDLKKSLETPNVNIALDGSIIEDSGMSEAKTFVFTGSVFGPYENIKAFFDSLKGVGRFQKIQSFSIQKNDAGASPTEDTNELKGTFVVEYGYLPKKPVVSALDMPVFLDSKLDFSEVLSLQSKVTGVPILEKDQTGKPNPFQ